jgi:SAM-dependent methyltransferase/pimeloyl-ACP methyl ester carboxylesterase
MIADSSQVYAGQIRTEFVSFSNRTGLRLAACLDHTGELRARPWVIVTPKYGETKKSNLQLAYHLAANGLNVLRFDHTSHVGESEGRMVDFILPGAVEDISAALDFLAGSFGTDRVIIVANSLSARCALRVAARDLRVAKFIGVAGVVNLLATMSEIYQEDILGQYRQGRRWGLTNFLGLELDGDAFLGTVLAAGLHDLEGTIADAGKVQVPMIYFYAERDAWVRREEVEQVVAANPGGRLVLVSSAMHEVRENPRAAERLFLEIIWSCLRDTPCPPDAALQLAVPNKKLLLEQNRRERERMRQAEAPTETETEFWSGYLQKYSILERSSDYQDYLRLLGRLCRPLRPGALVLDAGCGNGLFGLWVLREARQSGALAAPVHPVVYVGLDLTERGLTDAMAKHLEGRQPFSPGGKPGLQYALADFDLLEAGQPGGRGLPFLDGTFDLICCSLVLSYLKQPQALLRELHRVLRPGGVLVTSSMKPHCDLSLIYRDSISSEVTAEEIDAGRNLLRAAGKIKLKEETGHYAFFSQSELAGLVLDAGFNVTETHLSLGEQAVVVKAAK